MSDATILDREKYISLETFRKDGSGVKTPVWSAPLDGKLIVFTAGGSYKVKRLRNNPRCRVAGCDALGKVIRTAWLDGTCRIYDDAADEKRAHAALRKKYGFMMVLTDFGAWIAGRIKKRLYLEITLQPS